MRNGGALPAARLAVLSNPLGLIPDVDFDVDAAARPTLKRLCFGRPKDMQILRRVQKPRPGLRPFVPGVRPDHLHTARATRSQCRARKLAPQVEGLRPSKTPPERRISSACSRRAVSKTRSAARKGASMSNRPLIVAQFTAGRTEAVQLQVGCVYKTKQRLRRHIASPPCCETSSAVIL